MMIKLIILPTNNLLNMWMKMIFLSDSTLKSRIAIIVFRHKQVLSRCKMRLHRPWLWLIFTPRAFNALVKCDAAVSWRCLVLKQQNNPEQTQTSLLPPERRNQNRRDAVTVLVAQARVFDMVTVTYEPLIGESWRPLTGRRLHRPRGA